MIPKPLPHPNDQQTEFGGEEHAAREMVRAPESAAQVDAAKAEEPARPQVQKPEGEHVAKVEHVEEKALANVLEKVANDTASAVDKNTLVLSPDTVKRAEEALAGALGAALPASVTDGLILTLKEHPNHGKAGLELCLQGPALTINSALVGEVVLDALKKHAAFDSFFAHDATTPHAMKPHEPEKADMMHVQVNNLTTEQYAALLHGLAGPAPEVAAPHSAAEQAANAQQAAQQAVTGDAAAPAQAALPAPANDAAMGLVQTQETPSNIVQAPVAALDRAAEPPQRAVG